MGTIKTGFWKINFILTPIEFKELLNSCVQKGMAFHLRTYGHPEHTVVQVIDTYMNAYQFLTSSEKPPQTSLALPYSMSFPKPFIGFSLNTDRLRFPYDRQWADAEIPFVQLTYQKGFSIDLEDEKGKYFIYEDIREHQPTIYPIFENLASEIKRITKPLRFEARGIDGYEQLKPPIRISEQAAHEVKEGWLFKAYQLQMKSYN
ncbi:hypothetical protein [Paenibacillus eucommiae]|uniref:Uncharacterized protein n=1 Tax=Paenibacillus eucommiae TaxID=1355755 RepID=A0ABS4JCK6_9BACL|nr:hypothetical protein [Paenibacillus eucommiae]MBP1996806.1 hypothetical protein [Paenibacillus eucommiae]